MLIQAKAVKNQKVYLSDFMQLSQMYNTVFNKSVTGIGGTSLALDSDENIIILMPFIEVVNNKEGYNADTFTVKGGVTVASLAKYLKTAKTRKIVSTYDGLSKIIEAYSKAKIDISDDFLLVDEWQVMFSQYIFRNPTMKYLLSQIKNFNKVCLMTATPIKKEWWFEEIKHLTELELDYNLPTVAVRHFKCQNIMNEATAIIKHHDDDKNLHFFCNSVDFIRDVLKQSKLKPEEVRIICSTGSEKNKVKLTGYKIESTKDTVKKVNFYTSTCFEGCDIFDENGKIYVLCDGNRTHTLVDIATTLPQIAGRIRDIKDGSIDLLYTSSRYIDVTEEEFTASVEANKQRAKELLTFWETFRDVADVEKLNCYYLGVNSHTVKDKISGKNKEIINNVEFDEALLNLDSYNYAINHTYSIKANLIGELSENFTPITIQKQWAEQLEELEQERVNRMSFREKVLSYVELSEAKFSFMPEYDKVVRDAVSILGLSRIEELNFHKGDVEKALISKSDISEANKIMKMLLKDGLRAGVSKTNAELKQILSDIYSKLGIKKAATATQIEKYFDVTSTKITVEDKRVSGYKLTGQKIVFI